MSTTLEKGDLGRVNWKTVLGLKETSLLGSSDISFSEDRSRERSGMSLTSSSKS